MRIAGPYCIARRLTVRAVIGRDFASLVVDVATVEPLPASQGILTLVEIRCEVLMIDDEIELWFIRIDTFLIRTSAVVQDDISRAGSTRAEPRFSEGEFWSGIWRRFSATLVSGITLVSGAILHFGRFGALLANVWQAFGHLFLGGGSGGPG